MKNGIIVSGGLLLLLLLYIRYNSNESFTDANQVCSNYPPRMKNVIKRFTLGYPTSALYPKSLIPKDIRCDPFLDCPQKVVDESGKEITLPPIRTKCMGNREAICQPIRGVKPYPLNPI
jgi:hypothetical protein